jgi:hypothetical protein
MHYTISTLPRIITTHPLVSRITHGCVLFLAILLSACAAPQQAPSPVLTGQTAAWTTQLHAAQQAAHAVDPQAVLIEVTASPLSDTTGVLPLKNGFEFVRPSLDIIRVSFVDTNITQTIATDPTNSSLLGGGYPAKKDREYIINALATVKISATEALQKTIADGQAFAEREHEKAHVIIGLQFDQATAQQVGILAVWDIVYLTSQKELRIRIDPSSGKTIHQEERRL